MADVKAILLNNGKRLLTGALTGFSAITPAKFRIGERAGFEPENTAVDVQGALVFEGLAGLMQVRRIADDTVRYTMMITENYGPFNIGNLVLYCAGADGVEQAMVHVVLPFTVRKELATPDLANPTPYPTPGSRFTINVTIRHSLEGDDIVVEVVNPEYSALPYYPTEQEIPASAINPWPQFVIHADTRIQTPTLVAKRSDGSYWGVPFWQNLRSPKFGVIDGGMVGDGHLGEFGSFLWGYYYLTPNSQLNGQVGGAGYITDLSGYMATVGGMEY